MQQERLTADGHESLRDAQTQTLTATGGVDASWHTQEARLLPTPTGAGMRRV